MKNNLDEQRLTFTIQEVAEALSVSPALIRKWQKFQKIRVVKLGRCVRIPVAELNRLAQGGVTNE